MAKELINPDYLFEVSWEVCNKVGGIYTVISTKALHQMVPGTPDGMSAQGDMQAAPQMPGNEGI